MGILNGQAQSGSRCPEFRACGPFRLLVGAVILVSLILGTGLSCFALQQNTLISEGQAAAGGAAPGAHQAPGHGAAIPGAGSEDHGTPQKPAGEQAHGSAVQPSAPPSHQASPAPADSKGHGAPAEAPIHGDAHGKHGPELPQISSIAGVTFVETMINLIDYELNGRFLGWRPNDIIIGRVTDNVNNYQLGVLEALRFTTLRLKDSLTRMGDADAYDPDLEAALNLLMNRATSFWFPSAESSYGEALDHLRNFVEKLKGGRRSFYYRKDNLLALITAYKDLLGNVNKSLIMPVSWWQTDDYFYYARGVAHVYYEILRVVRAGFQSQLASTLYGIDIMDEILHELHRVEEMHPWIVLDADLDGFLANHRANLNAPLSEVVHMLGVLSQL